MNRFCGRLGLLLLAVFMTGCSSMTVERYAEQQPALVPEEFFDGRLTAHGVVKNRGGEVIRRFNAEIKAYWKDGIGTLEEDFLFDDGEEQRSTVDRWHGVLSAR